MSELGAFIITLIFVGTAGWFIHRRDERTRKVLMERLKKPFDR